MINYSRFVEIYKNHHKERHVEKREEYSKDASCMLCYPIEEPSREFEKFWEWYQTQNAVTFNGNTQRLFNKLTEMKITHRGRERNKRLVEFVLSMRYERGTNISLDEIGIKIIEMFVCNKNFELSIEQAKEN